MQKQTLVICLKTLLDSFPNRKDSDETATLMSEWSLIFGDIPDDKFMDATKIILKKNKFFPSLPEMKEAIHRVDLIAQGKAIDEIKREQRLKRDASMTDEDVETYAWLFSHDRETYMEMKKEAEQMREDAKAELTGARRIAGGTL